ncbi:hypothetical protein WS95_00125 [Burkholderia sp. MSMB1826]|nr:hypothetical protein WS95_00125 [Burkholderia sp. MSMB1826]
MLGDRCQLLVMHDQHPLHISGFILVKRPRPTPLGARDTGIQYDFRSSVQVKIGTRSRLASHIERQIDDPEQANT